MASAWIRPEGFDALPGVCAKSGRPTEIRIPVTADYVPAVFRWLQLTVVYSFLFGKATAQRRRVVRLPISAPAFRLHRRWQLAGVAGCVAGVAMVVVGSVTLHPVVELGGYLVAAGALVAALRSHHVNWVGVTVDRTGGVVTVARCHPAFARAAGELARSGATSRRPRRLRSR